MRWLGVVAFLAAMGVITIAGLTPRRPSKPDPIYETWLAQRDALRRAREAGL